MSGSHWLQAPQQDSFHPAKGILWKGNSCELLAPVLARLGGEGTNPEKRIWLGTKCPRQYYYFYSTNVGSRSFTFVNALRSLSVFMFSIAFDVAVTLRRSDRNSHHRNQESDKVGDFLKVTQLVKCLLCL